MKILIIEDEDFAVKTIEKILLAYDPNIEVLDVIDSVEDAVEWFSSNPNPDLVLLDIHLADGLSFEIFDRVVVSSPIIFTTAYDQYAIEAFKTKSVDYLLKPVKYEEFERAMNKFQEIFVDSRSSFSSTHLIEAAEIIRAQKKIFKSRFLVKAGNLIKSVSIEDVGYFLFEDRLTLLVTHANRKYPVKHTLDELETLLDPIRFFRANRQFIVAIDSIDKIHPYFKGRLKLELTPLQEHDLVISSEKTRGFKDWLDR